MAVSIVNGYFCASSCDVSKAKKGEDPHPSTDPGNVDGKDRASPRADEPAVQFGGALSVFGTDAVAAAVGTAPTDRAVAQRPGQSVDVLA
jgi:hypothetical protein